jgi:hypothetical protein
MPNFLIIGSKNEIRPQKKLKVEGGEAPAIEAVAEKKSKSADKPLKKTKLNRFDKADKIPKAVRIFFKSWPSKPANPCPQ